MRFGGWDLKMGLETFGSWGLVGHITCLTRVGASWDFSVVSLCGELVW